MNPNLYWPAIIIVGCVWSGHAEPQLRITGVIDGGLPGGTPKGVELFASTDIPDLSVYGIGAANNGEGSDGVEFTFPADSLTAGQFLYIGRNADGWMELFGRTPDYVTGALFINGDDAIELFAGGQVIDTFGEVNHDGVISWSYADSYAYRSSGPGADGATFVESEWILPGPGALDGHPVDEQAQAVTRLFGFYSPTGAEPVSFSLSARPETVSEDTGEHAVTAKITLDHPLEQDLTIELSIDGGDLTEIRVPPSVVVEAGTTEAEFPIDALNDGALDGDIAVTVRATAAGAVPAVVSITVTDVAIAPAVVINEVHANTAAGDPNGDGRSSFDDEFVEVLNITGEEVDLSGWTLSTMGNGTEPTLRHVFPEGTRLADQCAIVVFQGIDFERIGPGDYGGARVQNASTGQVYLVDEDVVTLANSAGEPVSVHSFSGSDEHPGVSLTRNPDGTGPFTYHDHASERDLSPGMGIDGRPFPGVPDMLAITVGESLVAEPNELGFPSEVPVLVSRITGGELDVPLTVYLSSSAPDQAVPDVSAVEILAGEISASFFIRARQDDVADGDTDVVITANAEGYEPAQGIVSVVDLQLDFFLFEPVDPGVAEGETTDIVLTAYGLTSGLPLEVPEALTVTLLVDDVTELDVPSTRTIPRGDSVVGIPVTGVRDGEVDGDRLVTLTVSAAGFRDAVIEITVTNSDAAPWVINEILADPGASGDPNGDGIADSSSDEFVEIVNNTGREQDLSGWTISDDVAVRHVFPEGTIVADGGAVVVFGGGLPSGDFGGAVVQVTGSSRLGLNNDGDAVSLADSEGDLRARVEYGSEGNRDQSLARSPDLFGTFLEHSLIDIAKGAPWSPGFHSDGTPFAGPGRTDPLAVWREQHFGAMAGDLDLAGDLADPDGDDLANLVEYVLGRDPFLADRAAVDLRLRPLDDSHVELRLLRFAGGRPGAILQFEGSSALHPDSWTVLADGSATSTIEDLGTGFERVTAVLETPAGAGRQYYVRLRALME